MAATKKCKKCEEVKPLNEFNKQTAAKDGKQGECRDCSKAYNAAWYAANKERQIANAAAWYAANKELKAATHAAWRADNKERKAAYDAAWRVANPEKRKASFHLRRARVACAVPQRWRKDESVTPDVCYWCGCDDAVWHVEHIMPISLGGPAVESNEVRACESCNMAKSAKHPLVWIAEILSR